MAVLMPCPDAMSYNHAEVDDVHTPASDFGYSAAALMPSPAPGMFPFSQTGPADLVGSSWDSSTVEGAQNYADYQDQGAGGAYSPFALGHASPTRGEEGLDDFHDKWHIPTATEATTAPTSEPMRRVSSRSPTGSHKKGPSSSGKTRRTLHTPLAQASQLQYEPMTTGNASANQYLDLQHGLFPNLATSPYAADGLPYGPVAPALTQHVDPTCTQIQMGFEPSLATNSPTQSWASYGSTIGRSPSPPAVFDEPQWMGPTGHLPLGGSPTTTAVSSPEFPCRSPRYVSARVGSPICPPSVPAPSHAVRATRTNQEYPGPQPQLASVDDRHFPHDEFALPPAFGATRMGAGEGESTARDHPLYKQASPNPDGLFHCPWEGTEGCNHKPEKLKCNYDKFVDSHLKPYRCKLESCENSRFSSTACLLRHEREAHGMHGHGDKPYMCTYEGCDRAVPGRGFPRQWNLKDHMRRVHNDPCPPEDSSPPPEGLACSVSGSTSISSSAAEAQAKSRKRKTDISLDSVSSRKSSTSRKSSSKSSAKAKAPAPAMLKVEEPPRVPKSVERWNDHHNKLVSLVSGFTQPYDEDMVQYLSDAQDHLSSMLKISSNLSSKKSHHHQQAARGPSRRSYMKYSG